MSYPTKLPFFVYGTLRPQQSNYHLLRGRTQAEERAYADGLLMYALGSYPTVCPAEELTAHVVGDLITPKDGLYDAILHDLDRLEGYHPSNPQSSWYQRLAYRVRLSDGIRHWAWLYMGSHEILRSHQHHLIADGNWSNYAHQHGITQFHR